MEAPVAPRAESRRLDIRRNGVTEGGQTRLGALCRMLRFYGVPRRISLGFAHSAAAAGDRRRIIGRSVDLKQSVCSDGRKEVVRSVDLKQTICIYCEIKYFATDRASSSQNTCIYD